MIIKPQFKLKEYENGLYLVSTPLGNLKDKKAIIFCTYGAPRFAITTFFLNLPIRRLKRGVFHMCGIRNINYRRYFAVPFVSEKQRKGFLEDVRRTAEKL